jgi:hypothetical protein
VINKKQAKPTIEKNLREMKRMYNRAIVHNIINGNPVARLDPALYSQEKTKHQKIEPLTVEVVPLFLAEVKKTL